MKEPGGHFRWLDWLRFLSALMVVAFHERGATWQAWSNLEPGSQTLMAKAFFALTRPGWEAVMVFFVLSGFLVGGRLMERVQQGCFNASAYAFDRVTRIYVPLIPAMVFTAALSVYQGEPLDWRQIPGNLAGLQDVLTPVFAGNAVLWSLAYEIWFYILAGLAAIFVTTDSTRHRMLALVGILPGLMVFTKLSPLFLFCWLLGAAGYLLVNRGIGKGWMLAGVLTFGAGLVGSMLAADSISLDKQGWRACLPSREIAVLLLSAGLAVVLPALTAWRPQPGRLEKFERLGTPLAAFSYTLYLIHVPLIRLYEHLWPERYPMVNATTLGIYSARVVSILLVAWLFYLPFERNTGRIRAWLQGRPNRS